ncbi:MAG: asparaginase [Acidobacteriota bacterium]
MLNRSPQNPILVEVRRGGIVEAVHRGAIVAVEPDGKVIAALGNIDFITSTRSAIKPIQAIPFITSGAADRFNITQAELAVVCASHSGEAFHTKTVAALLERAGLRESDLRCGAHPPYHEATAKQLERDGLPFTQLHNNCSGKHTGMLATCVHRQLPTENYPAKEHPVQRDIISIFTRLAGLAENLPTAVDGCSAPTFGVPLNALALAFARLVEASTDRDRVAETGSGSQFQAEHLTPQLAEAARRVTYAIAARRIVAAMTAHPEMVGGTARFDTDLMGAANRKLICKVGAEAVHVVGVLPCAKYPCGLGIAIKIDDGAYRGLNPAVVETLAQLGVLDDSEQAELAQYHQPVIKNVRGLEVGEIRAVFDLR